MLLAFYILTLAGALGAVDVLYFHIYVCRLYTRRQSAIENVTHAVRSALFTTFFFVIMFVDARGAWWWLYPALCAVETTNSMLDTFLEKGSRADQGGLRNGEYCLHVFLSILMGGVMMVMLLDTYPGAREETSFSLRQIVLPTFFVMGGYFSMAAGLGFCVFDGFHAVRRLRGASVRLVPQGSGHPAS
jgi:hypothetical protein